MALFLYKIYNCYLLTCENVLDKVSEPCVLAGQKKVGDIYFYL